MNTRGSRFTYFIIIIIGVFSVQIIKVKLSTLSSDEMAALVSCTGPGEKPPPSSGSETPQQSGQEGRETWTDVRTSQEERSF